MTSMYLKGKNEIFIKIIKDIYICFGIMNKTIRFEMLYETTGVVTPVNRFIS